jgi:DNA-binding CsgD family transcriptional regulator
MVLKVPKSLSLLWILAEGKKPLTGLHSGYLSARQRDIWGLLRDGLTQSEIARRLSITRQTVHQLANTIPEKMAAALNDAAALNNLTPIQVDVNKGILFGWSREFNTETVIAMTREGLRVWYKHDLGKCEICPDRRGCKSTLLKSAQDLGVPLTSQERRLPPLALSKVVFLRALGRESTPQ